MADLEQLEMLERQGDVVDAEVDEQINPQADEAQEGELLPPLRDELADMLDFIAKAGGVTLPTIPQRFNHVTNLEIADAAIKLADKYAYDLRANILSTDSNVFAWLGLAFAVGAPLRGCFDDYKALTKDKEAANDKPTKASNTAAKASQENDANIEVVSGA